MASRDVRAGVFVNWGCLVMLPGMSRLVRRREGVGVAAIGCLASLCLANGFISFF